MRKNNKGFAISIMLYAMVLLIVTIFYIILAIVKNRYNTNEALVEQAVNYMTDNDDYALSGDRTKPIIVLSDNNEVYNGGRNIKIYIYDDDEGAGLDLSNESFTLTDMVVILNLLLIVHQMQEQ